MGQGATNRRRLGREAEDRAAEFLIEKGYTILTRRFVAPGGEIDVVAMRGDLLVFVEVKFRSVSGAAPEESVDAKKRSRMFRAAERFLASWEGADVGVRYDLVTIDTSGIRHYEEAFWP